MEEGEVCGEVKIFLPLLYFLHFMVCLLYVIFIIRNCYNTQDLIYNPNEDLLHGKNSRNRV